MTLELTTDEALVLFEYLARLDESDASPFEDPAEERVLWHLHAQLERTLTEPLRSDYRQLVADARSRVMAKPRN